MPPSPRLLVILIAGAFVLWHLKTRIQQASNTSDADAAKEAAWKHGRASLRGDERFIKLFQYAESQASLADAEPSGDTLRPTYVTVLNTLGQPLPLQDLAEGAFLVLYARGVNTNKQFSLAIGTGECTTTNLSAFQYQSVVPVWATSL